MPPAMIVEERMTVAEQIKAVVARLEEVGEPFDVIDGADWIEAVEAGFGRRLPAAFRCLVNCYAFSEFEIGEVTVFSNLKDGSATDITVAPFADPFMSSWLISRGYIQFGRRTASYDPVCFDLSEAKKKEPPVVVFDHEDILLERRRTRPQLLAVSFLQLAEAALHNKMLGGTGR